MGGHKSFAESRARLDRAVATAKFCSSVSPLAVGFQGLGDVLSTHLTNTWGTAGFFLVCKQHHPSLFLVPGVWMQDTGCTSILKPAWLARLPLPLVPHLREPTALWSWPRSHLLSCFQFSLLLGIPMATPCCLAFHPTSMQFPQADTANLVLCTKTWR